MAGKTAGSIKIGSTAALALAAFALSACLNGTVSGASARPESETSASPEGVKIVDRDVEAPEVFQVTDDALWDGRPSLGGVWVASPDATDPERVILRNPSNGKFVIGALFRREAFNPGPALQLSSDAAEALGLVAGAPTTISVTALRREEVAAKTDASKPLLDANEGIATTPLADAKAAPAAPDTPAATAAPAATAEGPAIPVVSGKQGGTLQIGIFSVEDNAKRAAATLGKAGFEASVRKETTQGKTWWSVTAKTLGDRATFLSKVKSLGFKDAYFVKG